MDSDRSLRGVAALVLAAAGARGDGAMADSACVTLSSLYGMRALIVLGAWAAISMLLLAAGSLLSALALAQARRLPADRTGRATGASAALLRAYSAVIVACAGFYYASLLALIVAAVLGGGFIFGFFAPGPIPIGVVVVASVLMLAMGWSVFFAGVPDRDPGPRLTAEQSPALRAVLDEVAAKIGTRSVDSVYLRPGAGVSVMERGGLLRRLRDQSERCLILGVGVLDGMTQGQLRSVLAHEYGHFVNKDTSGGRVALVVQSSLFALGRRLVARGAADWSNPYWLFVQAFYRIFMRISLGAMRLQEVHADRWAAFAYGSESFASGLTHTHCQRIRFNAHANATLKEVIDGKLALSNLYSYRPQTPPEAEGLQRALEELMAQKPSPYHSHPCLADRIELVRALGVQSPEDESSRAEAWALFADRAALEQQMTELIRGNVAEARGITIAAAQG
jgi:Zn-dependent protease with chaperone function